MSSRHLSFFPCTSGYYLNTLHPPPSFHLITPVGDILPYSFGQGLVGGGGGKPNQGGGGIIVWKRVACGVATRWTLMRGPRCARTPSFFFQDSLQSFSSPPPSKALMFLLGMFVLAAVSPPAPPQPSAIFFFIDVSLFLLPYFP